MINKISREYVVLVDERDNELGLMEKLQAHTEGRLHRAISVFIFNKQGQMLLQRRAAGKYHSPGLWTNACCSHPREREKPESAASRRLFEELGLIAPVDKAFSFIYMADMGNGLTEHEFDHVFTGITDNIPEPDPEEVAEWKYVDMKELQRDITLHPEQYTAWFRICMNDYADLLSGDKE